MRLRVALPLLGLVILLVASLELFRPKGALRENVAATPHLAASGSYPASAQSPNPRPDAILIASAARTNLEISRAAMPPGGASNGLPAESALARHQAYVSDRVAQLEDLAMMDDAASLDTILSELNNRDPEIRAAAREAAVQFGSRDAIPKLLDAITQTDDAKEKAALNEAVEFLKLPSLTEVLAKSKARQ